MANPSKIGYLSGVSLLVAAMTGPGLVTVPLLFQTSGWITSLTILILVSLISSFSSLLLCEAIGSLPGNEKFTKRIEYSNLCEYLITNRYKRAFIQIIVYLAIESFIIASIILSAQSLDSLFVTFFGRTCGISISPDSGWLCTEELGDESSPFGNRWMLLTAGFMTTLVFVIPMTWMRLSNNAKIQIVSFTIIIFVIFAWAAALILHGVDPSRIPIIGENQSQSVGIVLFNYAFITAVPSLSNELEEDGSIRKIVWTATSISTFGYITLGILGAMAFDLDLSTNIVTSIRKSELRNTFFGFSTYLFPFILLISVPINVIVIRYNLVRTGFCGENLAIFSTILPWFLVIPFQSGYWLNVFTNWTSLLFISSANFIIPFWLYILSRKTKHGKEKLHGIEGFIPVKHFRAFFPEGTKEWFSIWVAWACIIVGCSLVILIIMYDFVGLLFGDRKSVV